jgi:hypothetical protein
MASGSMDLFQACMLGHMLVPRAVDSTMLVLAEVQTVALIRKECQETTLRLRCTGLRRCEAQWKHENCYGFYIWNNAKRTYL